MGKRKIFISYSHKDEKWKNRLVEHLDVFRMQGVWEVWHDRRIKAGDEWNPKIENAINSADAAILLISHHFLASKFILEKEVPLLLERKHEGKIEIFPLIVKACPWDAFGWLKSMQLCPTDGKALSSFSDHKIDAILTDFVKEMKGKLNPTALPEVTQVKTPKRISLSKLHDMPADVKYVANLGKNVKKNEQGAWEAYYQDWIVMVYIPAGEFKMGQTEEEKQWLIDHIGEKDYNEYIKNELPLHTVYLDGYWMGKTEVTVKQFRIFVEAKGYKTDAEKSGGAITWTGEKCEHKEGITWKNPGFKQDDNHPVVCVSRNDVRAYCEWLSNKRGLSFKLPTEAQWEKAARGTDSRKYPWGNHEAFYNGKWHANYAVHYNWEQRGEDGFEFTSPVGSYPQGASPYGLLDMAGNVWEWCEDWYEGDYYRKSTIKNPKGPEKGNLLVVRGGSWSYKARYLRCAQRGNVKHSNRYDYVGFRLCQNI